MVLRSLDPVAQLVWMDERVVADDGDDAGALVVVAAGVILREPVLGAVGLAAPAREPLRDAHLLQAPRAPVRVVRVLGRLLDPLLPLFGLHLPYLGGRDGGFFLFHHGVFGRHLIDGHGGEAVVDEADGAHVLVVWAPEEAAALGAQRRSAALLLRRLLERGHLLTPGGGTTTSRARAGRRRSCSRRVACVVLIVVSVWMDPRGREIYILRWSLVRVEIRGLRIGLGLLKLNGRAACE
jgi:hypothetical protein